ncbi:class I SAM-dependent methyltransferase [Radiobacillus sp. PE A8.2]|uniref:class I SAM-dependent methyltransferase n=1 Tax=Radiobacillus sp. PE A8.2 TaxID=3380349 RepID=UPI00388DDCE4
MLKRVLAYAHELLQLSVVPGETVIDGTCGNGNDTIFLSKIVGEDGRVLAFDIQQQAVESTTNRMHAEAITNVDVFQEDHQYIEKYITPALEGKIGGAIFNLGYLPRSEKTIITKPDSTIKAVDRIAASLKTCGIIVLVVYYGHPGGELEKEAILEHLHEYDQKHFNVLRYQFVNQKNNPPFVLAIEKK